MAELGSDLPRREFHADVQHFVQMGELHIEGTSSELGPIVSVTVPELGPRISYGLITRWNKMPGDRVATDDHICEISADQVDVEILASTSGIVLDLAADVGEVVAVGREIAVSCQAERK